MMYRTAARMTVTRTTTTTTITTIRATLVRFGGRGGYNGGYHGAAVGGGPAGGTEPGDPEEGPGNGPLTAHRIIPAEYRLWNFPRESEDVRGKSTLNKVNAEDKLLRASRPFVRIPLEDRQWPEPYGVARSRSAW